NGPLNLIVPIVHNGKQHMKDVRISNQEKWQSIHWKSIVSSYRNSPYFEFYELDIRPLYLRQYDYLVDFNFDILHSIQSILDIEIIHEKSFEYIDATRNNQDLRSCFNAKNRKREVKPYVQVFAGKMDFEQDLSILDLIFNTGPEASIYLKQM
ncbi:MAG: WbqC family protein, partial [Flavobacteriales bacterium]|nr:WbqC family protein [Flavobacteriales bacterium]